MFIHPAVAPSRATGFAGSLMRRRLRLLQEVRLTRLFLSLSQTAKQVRREEGGKRGTCCEILRNTFSSCLLGFFKSFFFFFNSFSRWIIFSLYSWLPRVGDGWVTLSHFVSVCYYLLSFSYYYVIILVFTVNNGTLKPDKK